MFLFLCLTAQALVLTSVLSPIQNGWDLAMRFNSGFMKDKIITGMFSEHDNHHEDRRWRFYYGSASGLYCLRKTWTIYQNAFKGDLDFSCGPNEALSGIYSFHDDKHEDRRWSFQCCTVDGWWSNGRWTLHRERLTTYVNELDKKLDFECGSKEVLIGLKSSFHKRAKDRLWQARCAALNDEILVAGTEGLYTTRFYVNNWDRDLDFTVRSGYVITGLLSKHSNRKEDRVFKIHYSKLKRIRCNDLGWSSDINKYDGDMNYKCRANSAVSGLRSWHSNRAEDRRYRVRCCDLSNGGRYTISTYMTGYVNDYDGDMDKRCPNNDMLVGIYSHHENSKGDRRFKFYCGRLVRGLRSNFNRHVSRELEVHRDSYFFNKKIDEIFIIMTHNSLAFPVKVVSPNQNRGLRQQFIDGVRGFNFDFYPDGDDIKTCHPEGGWCYNPKSHIEDLMFELNKDFYDDTFIIIQLQSKLIPEKHYHLLEEWFGSKLVKSFNKEKELGYYMERGQQVLIFTDTTDTTARSSQGVHDTNFYIVENEYEWRKRSEYPPMLWRRGPNRGTRMRVMNYFVSNYVGSQLDAAYVHKVSRALNNIEEFKSKPYTGGVINGLLVDYYNVGNVFEIQKRVREAM